MRRRLAGVMLCIAVANPACADTTIVRVVASVMARVTIESQRLPKEVVISEEDVTRGYVDVPLEIGVRANRAVMLAFSPNSRQVAGIDIASGSAHVAQIERGMRSQLLSFLLRVRLAPGIQPGRIAFPVSVSLTPR